MNRRVAYVVVRTPGERLKFHHDEIERIERAAGGNLPDGWRELLTPTG